MPAAEKAGSTEKKYEMADVDSKLRSVHTSSRTRVMWGIGIAIVGGTPYRLQYRFSFCSASPPWGACTLAPPEHYSM